MDAVACLREVIRETFFIFFLRVAAISLYLVADWWFRRLKGFFLSLVVLWQTKIVANLCRVLLMHMLDWMLEVWLLVLHVRVVRRITIRWMHVRLVIGSLMRRRVVAIRPRVVVVRIMMHLRRVSITWIAGHWHPIMERWVHMLTRREMASSEIRVICWIVPHAWMHAVIAVIVGMVRAHCVRARSSRICVRAW
jgi:hypothetical protein